MRIKTIKTLAALLLISMAACSCKEVGRVSSGGEGLSSNQNWSIQYTEYGSGGPFDHIQALDTNHVWAFRSPSQAYLYDGNKWKQNYRFNPDSSDRFFSYKLDEQHLWLSVSEAKTSSINFCNGSEWVQQCNFDFEVDGRVSIDGINGLDGENVWAFGSIPGSRKDVGKIFSFDGTSWQKILETEGIVSNVVPLSNHQGWAVIASSLYSFDGIEWKKHEFNEGTIVDIYSSKGHLWSTDKGGSIYILEGDTWNKEFDAGSEVDLYLQNDNCVWAMKENGDLFYYDGSTWKSQTIGEEFVIKDMQGIDPSHVWAVGHNNKNEGEVYFFNGNSWELQFTARNDVFIDVAVLDENNIWALGFDTIFYGSGFNSE